MMEPPNYRRLEERCNLGTFQVEDVAEAQEPVLEAFSVTWAEPDRTAYRHLSCGIGVAIESPGGCDRSVPVPRFLRRPGGFLAGPGYLEVAADPAEPCECLMVRAEAFTG